MPLNVSIRALRAKSMRCTELVEDRTPAFSSEVELDSATARTVTDPG